jgi:uncharacterized membrane protein
MMAPAKQSSNRRFVTGGLFMGIGLGGFVDGIVLHQILQWHHMLTSTDRDNIGLRNYPASTVRGLEVNTLWDGLFHATAWIFVAVGLALVWRARPAGQASSSGSSLFGLLLAGWGLFNLVEGIVDHHLLGIHHVKPGDNQLLFDLAFLAFGVLLLAGGWALYRSEQSKPARLRGSPHGDAVGGGRRGRAR